MACGTRPIPTTPEPSRTGEPRPLRIGVLAPLKAPDHPVPSGDRQMARLLVRALGHAGHAVEVLSTLRTYAPTPNPDGFARTAAEATAEVERCAASWTARPDRRPDLVFTYHLYYKAPDLIGWPLARRFGLPYVTAEASHADKRSAGPWATRQAAVDAAVRGACLNLCFTANDRNGLAGIAEPATLADLPPFIDAALLPAPARASRGATVELVAVAMMRPGDKLDSYRFLARALGRLGEADWRLTLVGDGPARAAVEAAFAELGPDRVRFAGQGSGEDVAAALAQADVFVWPGFNEAFGLSYLEAQACGLPVVAVEGEGTPSVVRHGRTGLLTSPDVPAYAEAVARLVGDPALRARLGAEAARFVHEDRSLAGASARIEAALREALARFTGKVGA